MKNESTTAKDAKVLRKVRKKDLVYFFGLFYIAIVLSTRNNFQ